MTTWWNKQIERADELASQSSGSRELVSFYSQLLRAQKQIYLSLAERKPTGDLRSDLPAIRDAMQILLTTVKTHGPEALAGEADKYSKSGFEVLDELLLSYWRTPSDLDFFAKAFLQPYIYWLKENDIVPRGREIRTGERSCQFCGGNPQVGVLQSKEVNAESG